jgi:hypothetical protein
MRIIDQTCKEIPHAALSINEPGIEAQNEKGNPKVNWKETAELRGEALTQERQNKENQASSLPEDRLDSLRNDTQTPEGKCEAEPNTCTACHVEIKGDLKQLIGGCLFCLDCWNNAFTNPPKPATCFGCEGSLVGTSPIRTIGRTEGFPFCKKCWERAATDCKLHK